MRFKIHISNQTGVQEKFTVKNCRMAKQVRFKWLKPDFTNAINNTDVNNGGETRWILTLRLTPKIW